MGEERFVDGNALGGLLGEVLGAELTAAATTCAGCRQVFALAELHVYLDAPGAVGRCPGCGAVQVRVVRNEQYHWLDLRGVQVLQIPHAT